MSTREVLVGAEVRFRFGGNLIVGRVMEDRGPIGIRGRRLYLIRYELGEGNWYSIELPAEEIEVVEAKKEPA